MNSGIILLDRLTVAITSDLAEAVRQSAATRGLTVADYVRGSVQARLMLDRKRFQRLPDLHRRAARPLSPGRGGR